MTSLKQTFLSFFDEAINNSREEQLVSTCIISCLGFQARSIPRQAILWSKLQTLLEFVPDYKRSVFDGK